MAARPAPPAPPRFAELHGTVPAIDFEAREHVHRVVEASQTSFLQGMKSLPEERREAMFAIYAFCREIDDIADEPAPVADKIARLKEWRREIEALYAGRPGYLTARALAEPVREFGLDKADFHALIDGMEMDAVEDIRAPSFERLELYCDRVAGAVGRLSVKAFGATEPESKDVARELGQALQLTNILRDLKEDADNGRLYLPAELLDAAGIATREPQAVLAHPKLPQVCEALAARARQRYAAAVAAMRKCARGPMKPARLMMLAYRARLDNLAKRGWTRLAEPVSLSFWQKARIGLRYFLG